MATGDKANRSDQGGQQKKGATGRWRSRAVAGRTEARSSVTDRYVTSDKVAAARARVSADKKRGVITADWIVDLANG